ncbi:TasA family protein [Pseudonocardia broussonetiae]|uniref:SipW-cognate class signal peptide n=1 Tax=Pseudonocardia broussonetiae TaxID=2736640 RepID=A0A6M6JEL8_9PSEU|nr:TasA family protein [Pseudonocardia broussonetiae]QJY46354.1 hypothetical protein HOP40_11515 [Pseudonocardia broussonetiae]
MSILQKNKKLAAGIGVAAVAAAAVALGAGTYAAFTDTAEGPGGTLAAGTLSLDVTTNPSGTTTLFSASNIAPGYTSGPRTFIVENTGSIDGVLSGTFTVTGGQQLAEQIQVTGSCDRGIGAFPALPLSQLPAASAGFSGIDVGDQESLTCTFNFEFRNLDAAVNNTAQGQSVVVGSSFTLNQAPTS